MGGGRGVVNGGRRLKGGPWRDKGQRARTNTDKRAKGERGESSGFGFLASGRVRVGNKGDLTYDSLYFAQIEHILGDEVAGTGGGGVLD